MRTAWTEHTIASSYLMYWNMAHRTCLGTVSNELLVQSLNSLVIVHYFRGYDLPQISRRTSLPRMMRFLTQNAELECALLTLA